MRLPFSAAFLIAHHQRGINQTFLSYNAILPIQAGQDFHLRIKLKSDCTRKPLKFHALTVQ